MRRSPNKRGAAAEPGIPSAFRSSRFAKHGRVNMLGKMLSGGAWPSGRPAPREEFESRVLCFGAGWVRRRVGDDVRR